MTSNCRQHFVSTRATSRNVIFRLCAATFVLYTHAVTIAQMDVSTPLPLAEQQRSLRREKLAVWFLTTPQLADITASPDQL